MRSVGPIVLALCCLALLPGAAAAQNHPSLSVAGGVLFGSGSAGDQPLTGVKAGYWIFGKNNRDSLGIEGVLLRGNKDDLYLLRGDLLYPVWHTEEIRLFLSAGVGGTLGGTDDAAVIAYGAAVAWQPDIPFFLRLDGRQLREFATDQETAWEVALNLGYQFGFEPKPKPKPPADADGDGIPDSADRCPSTPKELAVDQRGCPKNAPDSDGDRVPDYLDRCPGTADGVRVASDGCPPDADGDGIPDDDDSCPNNPPGLPVDEHGCVEISR